MRNRCIAASGVPWSVPSVFFVVRLPKNKVVLFTISTNFEVSSASSVMSFRSQCDWFQFVKWQIGCHMTAAATLIAATIASCKHCVRGLTKPHVTSVLRLSSGMLSCLYSLHITQAYRPTYEVSCHHSPQSYILMT